MRAVALALCLVPLATGCGEEAPDPSEPAAPALPAVQSIAGRIGWTADAPFRSQRPSNDMRDAQYSVDGHPEASLVVSHFEPEVGGGGEVAENVARWTGQFHSPEGSPPLVESRRVNELSVTTVDVRGEFVGRVGMGPAGPPRPGWRMRGAIVEGPRGLVFFKLLGPEAALEATQDAFDDLLRSIHPE